MTARAGKDARHDAMVEQAKAYAAQLVNPKRPLEKLSRAELTKTWQILMDACLEVSILEKEAPAPRRGLLALAAEDGELTADGQALLAKRVAQREQRRARRAERAAS